MLVGLVLLIAVAGLFGAFAPVAKCPDCVYDSDFPEPTLKTSAGMKRWRSLMTHEAGGKPCLRCKNTHSVSFLNRFRQIDYECCN
jgi:hypothetical protein